MNYQKGNDKYYFPLYLLWEIARGSARERNADYLYLVRF